jgi:hypothetical protein
VGSLTSHNPIGLQGLLRDSFTFFYSFLLEAVSTAGTSGVGRIGSIENASVIIWNRWVRWLKHVACIGPIIRNSMELNSPWETPTCSASQGFPNFSIARRLITVPTKPPTVVLVLSQISPVHTTPSYLCMANQLTKQLRGFSSSSELYLPSDPRLSSKLVPTFADRGVSHGQC